MSASTLAVIWVVAGALSSLVVRRLRRRRLGAVVLILLGGISALATGVAAPAGPLNGGSLTLDRVSGGFAVLAGVSLGVALLLATAHDGLEAMLAGITGGAVILALAARSPLTFALAVLLAVTAVGVRWVTLAPTRATLAAVRVPAAAAACLLAAAPFLPVSDTSPGPRATLVAGLLLIGIAGTVALLPLGGWAVSSVLSLRSGDAGVRFLLVIPAVLLVAARIPAQLPLKGQLFLQHGLVVVGLVSALWYAARGAQARDPGQYPRVALADFSLFAAGIGTTQPLALSGGLLLVLTHLILGPLLLAASRPGMAVPRRAAWIALTGLPPTPSFWGRFLVLEGCAAANSQAGLVCVIVLGLLFLGGVTSVVRGEAEAAGEPPAAGATRALAWCLAAIALVVGLAPAAAGRLVFGSL